MMAESENDPLPEWFPEWFADHAPRVREVRASKEFIGLPGRFDFHEYAVMERFARSLPGPARDRTLQAMRGRGAFRGFKRTIVQQDVEDQ